MYQNTELDDPQAHLCYGVLQAVLLVLIQDLKDEGNQLFKDDQFPKACAHYKHAIFVARILEERYYHEVEHSYMATLYSNGSLGYLKTVSCFKCDTVELLKTTPIKETEKDEALVYRLVVCETAAGRPGDFSLRSPPCLESRGFNNNEL